MSAEQTVESWKPDPRSGGNGGSVDYFNLKDGERANFRILAIPKRVLIHRIPAGKTNYPATCLGENCPACAISNRWKRTNTTLVIDRRDGKVKIWEFSETRKGDIYEIAKEYGDPRTFDLLISRRGTTMEDTKYTIMPGKNRDAVQNIEQILSQAPNLDEYYQTNRERMETLLKGEVPKKKEEAVAVAAKTTNAASVVSTNDIDDNDTMGSSVNPLDDSDDVI